MPSQGCPSSCHSIHSSSEARCPCLLVKSVQINCHLRDSGMQLPVHFLLASLPSWTLQAGPVVERLAEHLADADAGVRTALRELLRDVVLPGLGPGGLAPFLPLLMAHITSAMTHLAAAVR